MAQYTVLNQTEVQDILAHYSPKKMHSFSVLSGGSENTNYLIHTKNESFVLSICEQKSMEASAALASLLEYLADNKFNTSKLVRTSTGELTTVWNDKPVMLKVFLEGTIVNDLSENLLQYLGRELAQLHQIKAPSNIPNKLAFGIENFKEVALYAPDSDFNAWLKTTQNYIENYLSPELPKALIHSDIFYNNIIVAKDEKRATIMDFEEACYYYRVFDIGMMIVGTCSNKATINKEKVDSLLKGYQQEIELLSIEKKALKAFTVYAATATAFWRHQNFNYINPNATMKEHYLEMQKLADFTINLEDNLLL
jgi:homoserine kinase type II